MSKILFNKILKDKKLNRYIVIASICLIVLIIIVITSLISNGQKMYQQEREENHYSESIIIEESGYYGEEGNIVADVRIPYFSNLKDSYNFYINDLIKNRFDYKKVYQEFTAGMTNADSLRFVYKTDYERYNQGKYISILVNEYAELEGNRPQESKVCYVIDAENSRTATLYDLFSNKQIYKSKIIEEVNKQAKEKNIEFAKEEGITELSDFQSFYIKDKKLHILFEASSVAANSYGDLDFEMPFIFEDGFFTF